MARLPVTHREHAFDYCMWELGSSHDALIPEGIVLERKGRMGTYYWGWDVNRYDSLGVVPEGVRVIPLSEQIEKPH